MTKLKQKTKEVFNKSAKTKDEQFEERQTWVNQSVGLVVEQYGNVEQFYINTECKYVSIVHLRLLRPDG